MRPRKIDKSKALQKPFDILWMFNRAFNKKGG